MQCPHDNSNLATAPAAAGLACRMCLGRWLRFREIEAMAEARNVSAALMFEDLALTTRETKLKCPSGCGSLKASQLPGVELDWCQACKGIWFDNGELTNLLAMHNRRIDSDAIANTASAFDFLNLLAWLTLPWR